MRTSPSIALAAVLLVLCPLLVTDSYAGYDKTEWGMALSQVRTLYPGGEAKNNQDGTIEYWVVQHVTELTAYVEFFFEARKGLTYVTLLFPQPGTEIDTKNGRYTRMTYTSADSAQKLLVSALTSKYGAPVEDSQEGATSSIFWRSTAGDFIMLRRTAEYKPRVNIGISYAKVAKRPNAEGL
jgi:hypothetical protein